MIGAGAIGQAFGHHFQRGGADVTFLVRPKYAAEARAGLRMYAIRSKRTREPRVFRPDDVLTKLAALTPDELDRLRDDGVI